MHLYMKLFIYIHISEVYICSILHLSVALNTCSLLSASELRDWITKQPSTYVWRVFGFHWVANAKEGRLWYSAQYEILTAFRSCKRLISQGCYALSDSLLSLAFATRWNPEHPRYVSTRLFCNVFVRWISKIWRSK